MKAYADDTCWIASGAVVWYGKDDRGNLVRTARTKDPRNGQFVGVTLCGDAENPHRAVTSLKAQDQATAAAVAKAWCLGAIEIIK